MTVAEDEAGEPVMGDVDEAGEFDSFASDAPASSDAGWVVADGPGGAVVASDPGSDVAEDAAWLSLGSASSAPLAHPPSMNTAPTTAATHRFVRIVVPPFGNNRRTLSARLSSSLVSVVPSRSQG
ncbi:MAG TPA: hypothetical protein VJ978_04635 [Nitriliruptoraceae bacterium]|nr:hypothetical protein [Nitriliruptoraceae bacterium]